MLEDNRHYFPPYDAVPVVAERDAAARTRRCATRSSALAGRITVADMRRMNYAVDAEHRDPADVVRASFLQAMPR